MYINKNISVLEHSQLLTGFDSINTTKIYVSESIYTIMKDKTNPSIIANKKVELDE